MKGVRELSRFMMPTLLGGALVLGVGIFAGGGSAFAAAAIAGGGTGAMPVPTAVATGIALPAPTPAPTASDFTMYGATATILQDIDTCGVSAGDPPNVESCNEGGNSDAFEVNARLRIQGSGDLLTDLKQDAVQIYLAPGDCASLDLTSRSDYPGGTFTVAIPAGSLKAGDSFAGKTYSFKGAVLDNTFQSFAYAAPALMRALRYGGLEFTVTVPWFINPRGTAAGSISVLGNGNMCAMTGPIALVLSFREPLTAVPRAAFGAAPSSDIACVDVPAPALHTLDMSQLLCASTE